MAGGIEIRPAHFPGRAPIDAYGNGGFRFADMSHRGSLLCLPTGMHAWPVTQAREISLDNLAPVLAAADEIDVLLVGLGALMLGCVLGAYWWAMQTGRDPATARVVLDLAAPALVSNARFAADGRSLTRTLTLVGDDEQDAAADGTRENEATVSGADDHANEVRHDEADKRDDSHKGDGRAGEQRDEPSLRGRPVVVAWRGARSVVCAASYEARVFGVRSAMPAVRAERLCPQAVFVPPDFARYKAVSRQVREIFARHTDLIEPLSLDEAYLDVTENKQGLASATAVAEAIRAAIREETRLTASAGIAPNKFLAKIASDWRKPDGQFVVKPAMALDFLAPLPVGKLPGVGKVMEGRLAALGIRSVGQLRGFGADALEARFGRWGRRLHELSLGIDEHPVQSERPTTQVSAEDTFDTDLPLEATGDAIVRLAHALELRVVAYFLGFTATFAFPVAGCRDEGFHEHGARMASPLNEWVPPVYRKRSVARPSVHWSSCSGSLPQHGRLIPITG